MPDPLSDLFGPEPGHRKIAQKRQGTDYGTTRANSVSGGVTVPWLATNFRIAKPEIVRRLRECPHLGEARNGGFLYDLPTAAA